MQTHLQIRYFCKTCRFLSAGAQTLSVVAATNRPNEIEPALRRPGRLDREILFMVPNAQV